MINFIFLSPNVTSSSCIVVSSVRAASALSLAGRARHSVTCSQQPINQNSLFVYAPKTKKLTRSLEKQTFLLDLLAI